MIVVQRDSGYADKLRDYDIVLDGKVVGSVGDNQSREVEVESGTHVLYIKLAWARSNKITFHVDRDEVIRFSCVSSLRKGRVFLAAIYALVLFNKYIQLKRTN